ncbi:AAA family ATPase [Nonomuraea sp. NPDC049400]|uniref:AAA family ATPase n=1 Tax=Nonomuraea sp. NPDC049400 TaxID=3364352 RepID=UPI00378AB263
MPSDQGAAPTPFRTSWTADELMSVTFPPTKWAVPGVIAEGLNLLAGPPKVGKSWLSLATAVAVAVAGGGKALEAIKVEPGPVLYLALEDTPRRLQSRMSKVLGDNPAPRGLTLATACETLPRGGDQAIARWLERNPGARMVVIDVFAKIRVTTPPGLSAYDADYTAMSRAKNQADTYGVAVVLVHHVRKMGSDATRKSWQAVTDVGWEHDQFAIYVWRSVRKSGDTKTVKSRRSLRIPVRCVTALKALLDERANGESVGKLSENRVFGTRNETAMTAENVRRDLRIALKSAEGINPAEWTPRELRHSFVSLLSAHDVPIEHISRLVGHTNTLVTEMVYRKQIRPVMQEGATVMDEIFPLAPEP